MQFFTFLTFLAKLVTFRYYRKTHLKWHCHYNPCPGYSGMPQYNGTHSLTRLVLHAILSESGPIRACHYTRDNPLVTYSGMPKPNTFFPMIRLERHAQTMWHAWVRL